MSTNLGLTCLLLPWATAAFVTPPGSCFDMNRKRIYPRLFLSSTTNENERKSLDRRQAIFSIASTTVGGLGLVSFSDKSSDATIYSSVSLDTLPEKQNNLVLLKVASVDDIVTIIESACDKRYLHAVASLGYENFIFRGIPSAEETVATVRIEPFDLFDPNTYGSVQAVSYFQDLEAKMKDLPIHPSNGHLATTNVNTASEWGGTAASIWPLGLDVHYSWFQEGGLFWPRNDIDGIVVDGIDCGMVSLEDALLSPETEILFCANKFLAVPIEMQSQVVSKLKSAFII